MMLSWRTDSMFGNVAQTRSGVQVYRLVCFLLVESCGGIVVNKERTHKIPGLKSIKKERVDVSTCDG